MSLYRKEYLTYIGYSPVYKYLPNYNDHSKDISKLSMFGSKHYMAHQSRFHWQARINLYFGLPFEANITELDTSLNNFLG